MKYLLFAVLALIATSCIDETIFFNPDQEADFPGGAEGLQRYISKTVRYPEEAINEEIEGRVMVTFIVEKNGAITHVTADEHADSLLRRESERVIKMMPRWTPGREKGKLIRTRCRLPIVFALD